MKKEITFQSKYSTVYQEATEWLDNLAKCFKIKSASFECYSKKFNWYVIYKCKVKVQYE